MLAIPNEKSPVNRLLHRPPDCLIVRRPVDARIPKNKKPRAGEGAGALKQRAQARLRPYELTAYFLAAAAFASVTAAWAAARRATGTRNGEQET